MKENKAILRRYYEAGSAEQGARIMQEGMRQIAGELNDLVNRHIEDLPLLIACIKGAMPHWERHLGENGRFVCEGLMRGMMTIDETLLRAKK